MKKEPLRMCVACRQMKPKDNLVKVVKNNNGVVSLAQKKSEGRGAYICKSIDCFEKCIKTKALSRALDTAVSEDVFELIKKEICNNE